MQAQNTFTDGMVLDTNPMMVPNTAMTDALNATLVTMNGNEMVLQNDMGNARVNRAALPADYVPVGMKEYGGIIYIACYNPITGKGQIGSFPSPQRNIDVTEKIGINKNLTVPIIDNGKLLSPITKIELFDNKIIRSGDKFSINIEQLPIPTEYISNCEYIYDKDDQDGRTKNDNKTKKIISPQNRMYTLGVATMDSNGQLNDITEKMKRYDINKKTGKTGKNPIKFDINDSDLYKFNKGYFLSNADNTNATSPVAAVRNKVPINTYNSKLFGKLYLWARYNVISSIEVGIIGMLTDSKTSTIALTDGQEYVVPDKSNSRAILYYIVNYKYNCPDGAKENESLFPPLEGYAYYYSGEPSIIDGVTINGNIKPFNTPCNSNSTYTLGYNYPIYDKVTNLYSFSQIYAQEVPNSFIKDIWDWELIPKMHNESQSFTIPALAVKGSIDLTKLNSGLIRLNAWRYIVDNDNVRISWGFEAYPIYGTSMSNVQFVFRDLQNPSNKIETYIPAAKASYNGEFVDIFSTKYFHTNLESKTGCLIEVDIQYNVTGENDSRHEYRWLIPTGLYNASYFGTGTNENDDFYSYIKDYNDFLNCAFYFKGTYWEFNGSKWASVGSSTSKDIIPSDYFMIEIQKENKSDFSTKPEINQTDIDQFAFKEKFSDGEKKTVNATYSGTVSDQILLEFSQEEKYPLQLSFAEVTYSITDNNDSNNKPITVEHDISLFREDKDFKYDEPIVENYTIDKHTITTTFKAYSKLIGEQDQKQMQILESLYENWKNSDEPWLPKNFNDYGLTIGIGSRECGKNYPMAGIFMFQNLTWTGEFLKCFNVIYNQSKHSNCDHSPIRQDWWYNGLEPQEDWGSRDNDRGTNFRNDISHITEFLDLFQSNIIVIYGIGRGVGHNQIDGKPDALTGTGMDGNLANTGVLCTLMSAPFCSNTTGHPNVKIGAYHQYYNYIGMLIKNTVGEYTLLNTVFGVELDKSLYKPCSDLNGSKQVQYKAAERSTSDGTKHTYDHYIKQVFSNVFIAGQTKTTYYFPLSSANYTMPYNISLIYNLILNCNYDKVIEAQTNILNNISTITNKNLITYSYYINSSLKLKHELGTIKDLYNYISDFVNANQIVRIIEITKPDNTKKYEIVMVDNNKNKFQANQVYYLDAYNQIVKYKFLKVSNNKLIVQPNDRKVPSRGNLRYVYTSSHNDINFTWGGINCLNIEGEKEPEESNIKKITWY